MSLGDAWTFPAAPHEIGLGTMLALAGETRRLTADCDKEGHPVDLAHVLDPQYSKAASALAQSKSLPYPIPRSRCWSSRARSTPRCTTRTARRSASARPDLRVEILSRSVARSGQGVQGRVSRSLRAGPSAADDVGVSFRRRERPAGAGRREDEAGRRAAHTLEEWIHPERLDPLQDQAQWRNIAADLDRVIRTDRIVSRVLPGRGMKDWRSLLDSTRAAQHRLPARVPAQGARGDGVRTRAHPLHRRPTARDPKKDRDNVMHEASKLRPIVADESLTDLPSLLLAREIDYAGVTLKACKGQTPAMLLAAAAEVRDVPCVQDLTCPGASLILSAGIAAASRQRRHRGQRAAVHAGRQCRLGGEFPGPVHDQEWADAARPAHRPGLGAVPPRPVA